MSQHVFAGKLRNTYSWGIFSPKIGTCDSKWFLDWWWSDLFICNTTFDTKHVDNH